MNAVEIEQAISELAEKPFDRQEFPFQFLEAFGFKETTIRRLRTPLPLPPCVVVVDVSRKSVAQKMLPPIFMRP